MSIPPEPIMGTGSGTLNTFQGYRLINPKPTEVKLDDSPDTFINAEKALTDFDAFKDLVLETRNLSFDIETQQAYNDEIAAIQTEAKMMQNMQKIAAIIKAVDPNFELDENITYQEVRDLTGEMLKSLVNISNNSELVEAANQIFKQAQFSEAGELVEVALPEEEVAGFMERFSNLNIADYNPLTLIANLNITGLFSDSLSKEGQQLLEIDIETLQRGVEFLNSAQAKAAETGLPVSLTDADPEFIASFLEAAERLENLDGQLNFEQVKAVTTIREVAQYAVKIYRESATEFLGYLEDNPAFNNNDHPEISEAIEKFRAAADPAQSLAELIRTLSNSEEGRDFLIQVSRNSSIDDNGNVEIDFNELGKMRMAAVETALGREHTGEVLETIAKEDPYGATNFLDGFIGRELARSWFASFNIIDIFDQMIESYQEEQERQEKLAEEKRQEDKRRQAELDEKRRLEQQAQRKRYDDKIRLTKLRAKEEQDDAIHTAYRSEKSSGDVHAVLNQMLSLSFTSIDKWNSLAIKLIHEVEEAGRDRYWANLEKQEAQRATKAHEIRSA